MPDTSTAPPQVLSPSEALETIGKTWWEETMSTSPFWATHLGDRRFDHLLPDLSDGAEDTYMASVSASLKALNAVEARGLSTGEQVVRDVLHAKLSSLIETAPCHDRWWEVDPLWGLHIQLAQLPKSHSIRGPADVANLVKRYRASPAWFEQHMANLRKGAAKGYLAARLAVRKVASQARSLAQQDPAKTPFVVGVRFPAEWDEKRRSTARDVLTLAVKEAVLPTLKRYAAFLRGEYMPHSRDKNVGASGLPDGAKCYGAKIHATTGSRLSPQEIHDMGIAELKILRVQMAKIAQEITGNADVKAFMEGLESRPDQVYQSAEELLADAKKIMDRAFEKLPTMFGRLPRTAIEIKPMEAYRAKDAPAAFYNPAPADGSRKAQYIVNTHDPSSRPRYNMEALSFHEAVPGHHLQIAIARETPGIPNFQRYMGQTAYVEGWALYSELLAAEMGLYSGPLGHFGKLNFQAWRACRLVVDTGLHALGWSRQRAIDFMLEHTANSPKDVEVEIDRYIVWPGQALGYMMGRMAMMGFRAKAEKALGEGFNLSDFHDEILRYGAVPIDVLSGIVDRWIVRQLDPK